MTNECIQCFLILWLVAILVSIVLIQYQLILGLYLAAGLAVVGLLFYVVCKYREYYISTRPILPILPIAVLPPAIPSKPPIVIMENGLATHVGVPMGEIPRPLSIYIPSRVPVYVARI